MTKLRECPFCGGDDLGVFFGMVLSVVVCQGCGAEADESQWNRRADDRYTLTDAGRKAMGGGNG